VVVIGEKPYAEGMGDLRIEGGPVEPGSAPAEFLVGPMEPYGDTLELARLHPEDLETIKSIRAQGIPVVAVLVSGRPLVVNQELEEASAFVAAWLPGSEGQGVADVLFGDYDFQGRLPFSWPKADTDNPNRGDQPDNSLFPYGFGLTMTG
jgi:beta-glucosidase